MKRTKTFYLLVALGLLVASIGGYVVYTRYQEAYQKQVEADYRKKEAASLERIKLAYLSSHDKHLDKNDEQIQLRSQELDSNGVTLYFSTKTARDNGASVDRYRAKLDQEVKAKKLSSKMRDYLLGEPSDLHFLDMTYKEIQSFDDGVKLLSYAYEDSNGGAADRARADFIDTLGDVGQHQ